MDTRFQAPAIYFFFSPSKSFVFWRITVLLECVLRRRFEELTNLIKTIRNAMKIRDMAKCLEEFEQLCRAFLKSKNIVDKEGVPPFYIRLLADLEDYLNQVSPFISLCLK